jgi:hypothetical protein
MNRDTPQRRSDGSPLPSATRLSESVLPIRLRPKFLIIIEGYSRLAVHLLYLSSLKSVLLPPAFSEPVD